MNNYHKTTSRIWQIWAYPYLIVLAVLAIYGSTTRQVCGQMVGSRIQLETFYPSFDSQTSTRPIKTVSVSDVEFPNVFQYQASSPGGSHLVNVNIDFSDASLTIDFTHATDSQFASYPVNTYVFTDVDDTMPDFTGFTIDPSTTLAIDSSAVTFNKNQLFINVSGLSFNNSTIAKFNVSFAPQLVKLANLSTRLAVGSGDNVLIGGFIVTGTQPKNILARAIGPSLPVSAALADPVLELHDATGAVIGSNDDWADAPNAQAITGSGIPPSNSRESALLMFLAPGSYTTTMHGNSSSVGIGLVEIYDMDPATEDSTIDTKLANISTRGLVQTGDNVMIAGLIITGPHNIDVAVRAIGPSLANLGVEGSLQDPILTVYDGNGAVIAENDNWQEDERAADLQAFGIAPSDTNESALLRYLAPGAYTAIVQGSSEASGVALVEIYRLSN